ncbi:MAG TPA: hypothetical protein VGD91_21670, partial [Trebonia sp.]
MRLPILHRRSLPPADGGLAVFSVVVAVTFAAFGGIHNGPGNTPSARVGTDPAAGVSTPAVAGTAAPVLSGASPTRLVVPDVIASVPGGLTPAELARVAKLGGVRSVLAID